MKKRIIFLINPVSGGKDKSDFPRLAEQYLDKQQFLAEYVFTQFPGHAFHTAQQAISAGADIVVAVGGDGTVNEVASALEGTGKPIGIIPCGSGNGLARFLSIPLIHKKAILTLNALHENVIDSGTFNQKKFFNVAGLGFDAQISSQFAKDKTRGLKGYIKTSFQEIAAYKPQHYQIEIDGKVIEREAFMLSIANSSQFGNNAFISPSASVKDGLLDVCIIKPFPLYHFPVLAYRLFKRNVDKSKYVEIIRGKEIKIVRETPGPVHVDGEPEEMTKEIIIKIKPLSLKILV